MPNAHTTDRDAAQFREVFPGLPHAMAEVPDWHTPDASQQPLQFDVLQADADTPASVPFPAGMHATE